MPRPPKRIPDLTVDPLDTSTRKQQQLYGSFFEGMLPESGMFAPPAPTMSDEAYLALAAEWEAFKASLPGGFMVVRGPRLSAVTRGEAITTPAPFAPGEITPFYHGTTPQGRPVVLAFPGNGACVYGDEAALEELTAIDLLPLSPHVALAVLAYLHTPEGAREARVRGGVALLQAEARRSGPLLWLVSDRSGVPLNVTQAAEAAGVALRPAHYRGYPSDGTLGRDVIPSPRVAVTDDGTWYLTDFEGLRWAALPGGVRILGER